MEEKVINILLGIKADIGELKQGQSRLEGRMDRLEVDVAEIKSDVAELKDDMSDVKSTVNALADALLETSREVKQIKGKAVHA